LRPPHFHSSPVTSRDTTLPRWCLSRSWLPPGFEERAVAVADAGLAAGDSPARARRAARLLQAYELMYWDTLGGQLQR